MLDRKANERKRKVHLPMRLFFLHSLLMIEYINEKAFTLFENSYDKLLINYPLNLYACHIIIIFKENYQANLRLFCYISYA